MKKLVAILCIVVLGASMLMAQGAGEKPYPAKPVTVIVPYGAGGDTDLTARLISQFLEKELGVPVVVTNMVGASGTIATAYVKDEVPADGYTVLYNHSNTLINYMTGLTDFTYTDFEVPNCCLNATSLGSQADLSYKSIQTSLPTRKPDPAMSLPV